MPPDCVGKSMVFFVIHCFYRWLYEEKLEFQNHHEVHKTGNSFVMFLETASICETTTEVFPTKDSTISTMYKSNPDTKYIRNENIT
jgi:hypothetical protein